MSSVHKKIVPAYRLSASTLPELFFIFSAAVLQHTSLYYFLGMEQPKEMTGKSLLVRK